MTAEEPRVILTVTEYQAEALAQLNQAEGEPWAEVFGPSKLTGKLSAVVLSPSRAIRELELTGARLHAINSGSRARSLARLADRIAELATPAEEPDQEEAEVPITHTTTIIKSRYGSEVEVTCSCGWRRFGFEYRLSAERAGRNHEAEAGRAEEPTHPFRMGGAVPPTRRSVYAEPLYRARCFEDGCTWKSEPGTAQEAELAGAEHDRTHASSEAAT